jgi:dipeptidyl-peptidase 4
MVTNVKRDRRVLCRLSLGERNFSGSFLLKLILSRRERRLSSPIGRSEFFAGTAQKQGSSSRPLCILAAVLSLVSPLLALRAHGQEAPSRLSVARIYGRGEFGAEHVSVRWQKGRPGYLTLEPSAGPVGGQDIVEHNAKTGAKSVVVSAADLVPPGESSALAIEGYSLSADNARVLIFTNSKRVWRRNTRGDYWVLDRASHELWKLGGDAPPSSLMHAKFDPSGSQVAYVRDNNLYRQDLRDHRITQLTYSTSPDEINGTFDWVYEEEFFLRDGYRWSPDGSSIAYWQLNTKGVPEYALVNYTDSLYPQIKRFPYPKVGQPNAACRVGVVSVAGGETRWFNMPGNSREHYIVYLEWLHDSSALILQQFTRRQDTVRVMLAHPHDGSVSTLLTEHDDAWLDLQDELRWLGSHKEFLWLSERDGWQHLYRVGLDGGQPVRITPGDFDVIQVLAIDNESSSAYFTASPDNATERYLYRVHLDGKGLERVTPAGEAGTHDYQISPDARWAIHTYSAFDKVPATTLVSLPAHEVVRVLADNAELKKKMSTLSKTPTEFFRVDLGGGTELDAFCILPAEFDSTKKYPLLVHVYGEPAGVTVVNRWDGGDDLWHRMLAQEGYVVMSFDNRGTPAPRGRAWRKAVFHQVGILAPKDQAAAVKEVLRKRPYIDRDRIGIWGWSGGGSMTLNAMFKFPDLYKTGISVAPVANQRYYDTIYQERYMGLPGDNVEGFIQGSAITFAHQLKGNLLLIHGTGDDNCHYQGTEALINELIRHNKQFTMMAYPNRTHSISEGAGTTLHLRTLMTRYLKENLRPGPLSRSGQPSESAASAR